MKCPRCQSDILYGESNCSYCGADLTEERPAFDESLYIITDNPKDMPESIFGKPTAEPPKPQPYPQSTKAFSSESVPFTPNDYTQPHPQTTPQSSFGYAPQQTQETKTAPAPQVKTSPVAKKASTAARKGIIGAILCLCLIVTAGLGISFLVKNKDDNPQENKTTTGAAATQNSPTANNSLYAKLTTSGSNVEIPKKTFEEKTFYTTADAGLNLRQGASTESASLGVLPKNTKITAFGESEDGSWYVVYCESTKQFGWVFTQYIKDEAQPPKDVVLFDSPREMTIDSDIGLNLREGAGPTTKKITLMKSNSKVTALGQSKSNSKWFYVETTQNGKTYKGFTHSDYLK